MSEAVGIHPPAAPTIVAPSFVLILFYLEDILAPSLTISNFVVRIVRSCVEFVAKL